MKYPKKIVKKVSLPQMVKEGHQKQQATQIALMPKGLKKPSKAKNGGLFGGRYN